MTSPPTDASSRNLPLTTSLRLPAAYVGQPHGDLEPPVRSGARGERAAVQRGTFPHADQAVPGIGRTRQQPVAGPVVGHDDPDVVAVRVDHDPAVRRGG